MFTKCQFVINGYAENFEIIRRFDFMSILWILLFGLLVHYTTPFMWAPPHVLSHMFPFKIPVLLTVRSADDFVRSPPGVPYRTSSSQSL